MTAEQLDAALETYRQRHFHELDCFSDGQCDALALALLDLLQEAGEVAGLSRIVRYTTRYIEPDEDEEEEDAFAETELEEDSNELSHVTLCWQHEEWDIDGLGAFERWDDNWYREPGENTEFEVCTTNEPEIARIRREKGETIDQKFRAELRKELRGLLVLEKAEVAA